MISYGTSISEARNKCHRISEIGGESLGAWTSSDVVMSQGIVGFDHYGIDRALWFGLPALAKWSRNGMATGSSDLVPEVSGPITWISPALVSGGRFVDGEPLLRIDRRDYGTHTNRALTLSVQQLNAVRDPHVRASLRL